MCAFYEIKITSTQLEDDFWIRLETNLEYRLAPYVVAPVIVKSKDKFELKHMNFSLVPSWSKERKVKFASHNARLFSEPDKNNVVIPINEKPTWRVPFQKYHCLVPILNFIEPIYTNELAGNMVSFFAKDNSLLLAAAVFDRWLDKSTGEIIESFAILTHDPPPYVASVGHDRCPVFLGANNGKEWLNLINVKPGEQISFLIEKQAQIDFDVKIDRPLKKGWEKRIS